MNGDLSFEIHRVLYLLHLNGEVGVVKLRHLLSHEDIGNSCMVLTFNEQRSWLLGLKKSEGGVSSSVV